MAGVINLEVQCCSQTRPR